jgi:beta-glucosidase/6-phospho-beta-glucosidase/beta-galactosidase
VGGGAYPLAVPLPDGFRFGVATSGFQIEGGYNGPGQPANN